MRTYDYYVYKDADSGIYEINIPALNAVTQAETRDTVVLEVRDYITLATGSSEFVAVLRF